LIKTKKPNWFGQKSFEFKVSQLSSVKKFPGIDMNLMIFVKEDLYYFFLVPTNDQRYKEELENFFSDIEK
jgi:hypothetical protein